MATNYQNFSVSRKKAQFYLKAKQPTEGYEEVTYGTNGDKTYHKYFKYVQGYPSYFGVKEVQYEGRPLRFLELSLKDGDTINKISVPLKNKGGYTDEARKLISALYNADLTEELSFSLKNNTYTKSNGQEAEDLAIYGNYVNRKNDEGRSQSTGFIPFSDIPKPESKEVAGDTVWDFTPQTEFFYQKLQEVEARFVELNSEKPTAEKPTAEEPKQKDTTTVSNKKPSKVVVSDDLPF